MDNGLPKKQSSRDGAFRPEGPWKLSPGFNLGCPFNNAPGLKERSETRSLRLQKLGLGLCTDNPPFTIPSTSSPAAGPSDLADDKTRPPRLKPGLSFQGASGRTAPRRMPSLLIDSSTIGTADPTQLRRQRLRISDWQFTSKVATNVGSRAPVNQIHPPQLRDLLSKPLFPS